MRNLLVLFSTFFLSQSMISFAQQGPPVPAPQMPGAPVPQEPTAPPLQLEQVKEQPLTKAETTGFKAMVKKLGNPDFLEREKAQKQLQAWIHKLKARSILPLKDHYLSSKSPEVRARLLKLLERSVNENHGIITRGFVGIQMAPIKGAVSIAQVQPNTPAAKHGLLNGDIIAKVDDEDLSKIIETDEAAMEFFSAYIKAKRAGDTVTLHIQRNNKPQKIEIVLGDYDAYNFPGQQQKQKENKFKQWKRQHLPDEEE